MKIIKKLFFLLVNIQILMSCSNNNTISDEYPYYKFSQNDLDKLVVKPIVGNDLVYKNQDNQKITFKVYTSNLGKTSYTTGNFSSSHTSTHYYYDQQLIKMWYKEGNEFTTCKIELQVYPMGSNYLVSPAIVGKPQFIGIIDFPIWNGYSGDDIYDDSILIDFNAPTISMNFNGKIYNKVFVFESNKTEILRPDLPSPPYIPKNVNKLYYDQSYGIIGFDDINGKNWRLE